MQSMAMYSTLVWYFLAALVIYLSFTRLMKRRQLSATAKETGAQPPVLYPNCGLGGLAHFQTIVKADKDNAFPDMLVARQNLLSKLHGREVSTFGLTILFQDVIFTSDPRNLQAMLATQFADYGVGQARLGNMIQTLGDGIFTQEGPKWQHSRALLRPSFARTQISDLELEERHLQNLLTVMPVQTDGWTAETDIQTLFFRLTIDASTEFLFGESIGSQLAEAHLTKRAGNTQRVRESDFSHHFDSAQRHIARRFRLGDLWWVHNPKSYKENNRFVHECVDQYVQTALQKLVAADESKEEKSGKRVFLEELVRETRDPIELRAQLLNLLLAGRDTTASLLSWTFHELVRHPEIFRKLRSTIMKSFGGYEDPRGLSFANLKDCQYLQHCLMEALRLWSIVPANFRRTNKITMLPKGGGPDGESPIALPANFDVHFSTHVMHRRKDIWGQDADIFKPERFVDRKLGWEFLPFSGGPRICIGQQLALTEASYIVVRLLQRFDCIEPGVHELTGPVKSDLGVTNAPAKHVMLRLHAGKD